VVSEVPARVLLKRLRAAEWLPARTVGSHTMWKCVSGRHQIPVPDGHRMISPGVHGQVVKMMATCTCDKDSKR
jgi:predicted RNA binding protein YcfA (HicA-like mRNA interferase family)